MYPELAILPPHSEAEEGREGNEEGKELLKLCV